MNLTCTNPFSVALSSCTSYNRSEVEQSVNEVLIASNIISNNADGLISPTSKVLIKPNLLRAHKLTCTHPEVVRALCVCLKDYNINISIADSPGFGFAQSVAKSIGLSDTLKPLGLEVKNFDACCTVPVGKGKNWQIAKLALESDHIISVPRLKTHCQMRLTLAVKNIFGCICGMHKALAHAVQGRSLEEFCHSILTLYNALPPTCALIDGIEAMHVTGPSGGKPFDLGLIGASKNALALDVAIYKMLKLDPSHIPLWQYAALANYPAAHAENLSYTLKKPTEFNSSDFILPQTLEDTSFLPHRLLQSLWKRFLSRF